MNINKIITVFGLWALFACVSRDHYSPEVEDALALSGNNRKELVKVLKHYAQSPVDSLKFRAAEFLIANMPGKYSEFYDAPWNDAATVFLRLTSSSDKQRVLDSYKLKEQVIREDIKHITAAYLINNIDLAFQVWRDKPWGKHVTFDTFCEEILPYRVSTEPLENWREKVLASFADIDKAFKENPGMTAVKACSKVNSLLPRFRLDKDFPPMNYSQLMASTRSMCDGETALAAFVMRALGIPVAIDFTPHWTFGPMGHQWNSVCDSTGKHISFMGAETNPHEPHIAGIYQKAKVYRQTFERHRIVRTDDEHIPPVFKQDFIDISDEYNNHADATIPAGIRPDIQTGYAYLALLYDYEWHIVGHGNVDGDSIRYPSIGKNVIYLPLYYANGKQSPAGVPFYINNNGEVHFFEPAASQDTLLSFRSIAVYNDKAHFWQMLEGIFEAADNPDFSGAKVLHTIKNITEVYNRIALKTPACYRYVRYRAPKGSYGNVAEITFLDANNQKLNGKHIGAPGSYNNGGETGDKAFDDDIMTFYCAEENNNGWTGLDLKRQQCISAIQYTPRLEGYGIYAGHKYTLYYWAGDSWKSQDIQTASGTELTFRIPRNSLCYIYNNTIRKRGQAFIQKGNDIIFYGGIL